MGPWPFFCACCEARCQVQSAPFSALGLWALQQNKHMSHGRGVGPPHFGIADGAYGPATGWDQSEEPRRRCFVLINFLSLTMRGGPGSPQGLYGHLNGLSTPKRDEPHWGGFLAMIDATFVWSESAEMFLCHCVWLQWPLMTLSKRMCSICIVLVYRLKSLG